jgi:N6-L-threonylcarbamoyladenine synthase/protein kinase Bud32
MIDFGMAEASAEEEARGVDLHLFLQCAPGSGREFREGYREGFQGAGAVLRRTREISRRVRYYQG